MGAQIPFWGMNLLKANTRTPVTRTVLGHTLTRRQYLLPNADGTLGLTSELRSTVLAALRHTIHDTSHRSLREAYCSGDIGGLEN